MDRKLEERIKEDVDLKFKLEMELSEAIAQVLRKYEIGGEYIFNVRRDADYCQPPIEYLKGRRLVQPISVMGSGCARVDEPRYVKPI